MNKGNTSKLAGRSGLHKRGTSKCNGAGRRGKLICKRDCASLAAATRITSAPQGQTQIPLILAL